VNPNWPESKYVGVGRTRFFLSSGSGLESYLFKNTSPTHL
jgi:hypothetical protein